jgi:hypothetical protein
MRGRFRIAVGVAAVAALVPATIAVATQSPAQSARTSRPATVTGVLNPTYSSVDPAGVLGGGPIRGMILADFNRSPQPAISDLRRLRSLGVNTVAVNVYVHQYAPNSDYVSPTSTTVSDWVLGQVASHAHALGMAMEISPVIVVDTGRSPGSNFFWRGGIAPANPLTWWHYYNAMITHYTNVANAVHAEILAIGSELVSMQGYSAQWEHLALWVNAHYHGLTTYMSTGNGIFPIVWLGYLDIISTSAYYSLSSDKKPKVEQMRYVWNNVYLPKLQTLYTKFHKRILINEIGYASVLMTAAHPAIAYQADQPVSQQAQANAYQALLQAEVGKSWLRGLVWWHWDKLNAKTAVDRGYSMRDKKAECVIAHYWSPQHPSLPNPADTTADVCLANHIRNY